MRRARHKRARTTDATDTNRILVAAGVLLIATLVAYWPIREHDFVRYDDHVYVTENPHIALGITGQSVLWAMGSGYASNWHPLTWISHMLDVELFGLNAGAHHMVSLLIHIANSILVLFLFHRMTGAFWPCVFLAAVFALHPLHVESVAWASERKDVLSTLFALLTIGAYLRYVRRPRIASSLILLFAFALSLMSKPMMVTLPFVLLLLDYWPLQRLQREKGMTSHGGRPGSKTPTHDWSLLPGLMREKAPLFFLSAISAIITILVQREGGAVESWNVLPLHSRLANAALAYVRYAAKTVWPVDLAIFYPYPAQFLIPAVGGAVVLLAGISWFVWSRARHQPYLAVGWLWFLGTLIPVIGIVQVGTQAMADRYMYLPILGLTMMMSWTVSEKVKRFRQGRMIAGVLGVLILGSLFVLTRVQVPHWQNTVTLMRHAVSVTDNNWVAHSALGLVLLDAGRTAEALEHFKEGYRIKPEHPEAPLNLGNALRQMGNTDEALRYYREALRIKPAYAEAWNNSGVILASQGKHAEAISSYTEALRIKPDLVNAHFNLGLLLASSGRVDDAIVHYREALEINPNYGEAHNNLGVAYYGQRDLTKAVAHYREAIRIQPGNAQAHNNLGVALFELGQTSEAIPHYREAIRLAPDFNMARTNLSVALSRQNQPPGGAH